MIMNWLASTEASSWGAGFSYPKENTSSSGLALSLKWIHNTFNLEAIKKKWLFFSFVRMFIWYLLVTKCYLYTLHRIFNIQLQFLYWLISDWQLSCKIWFMKPSEVPYCSLPPSIQSGLIFDTHESPLRLNIHQLLTQMKSRPVTG